MQDLKFVESIVADTGTTTADSATDSLTMVERIGTSITGDTVTINYTGTPQQLHLLH